MNTENHYQETDLGNISLNPRGEYNPEESYEYLDLVVLKGGSYVCLAENGATITGISPESGKTTQYWQVITIPGSLTPEYIAMHDRVVNLSEQVDADAEEVRTSLQEVSEIEINVSNLQEQTRQSAEAAEQSKDSSAGYAASADASRQAAEESKQNIDAQVTGFDNHVAEKTGEAENDIEAARIAANKAIIAQQEQSVNEVARVGTEAVSTAQAAAQTATEKAQAAATSEKNAAASETAAKLSEENATKMAEQVATDKEQVAYDRTAVENAKQEMTGSVAQIEQNAQGISELKSELVDIKNTLGGYVNVTPYFENVGYLYYYSNNAPVKISDGRFYRFDVDNTKDYYLTSSLIAQDEGFPLVSYIDANGNQLGKEFDNQSGVIVEANNSKLTIPANTSHIFVNARGVEAKLLLFEMEVMRNVESNVAQLIDVCFDQVEKEFESTNEGKLYYYQNKQEKNVEGGIEYKFSVKQNTRYFVTTALNAQSPGFPLIVYLDSNGNAIGKEYDNSITNETIIENVKLNIPTGATTVVVNWRNGSKQAKLVVDQPKIDEIQESTKKEISILFVGNSLTQDGIAYLPYMLKTYYPNIKFKIYMWYNGGKTLAEQYQYFVNNTSCDIFSIAENTEAWTNTSKTMSSILQTYKFDIVSLQEYFNYKETFTDENIVDWNNCKDYITSNYRGGNSLKFVSLFHAPKRDRAEAIFNLTKNGNGIILKNTICEDIIPVGISVYRALSTDLDNLGDMSHLSPDGTHTQEGLPCLLQTYVALKWILEELGMFGKSVYGSSMRMTADIYNTINVPGANIGTGVVVGTDVQNILAQEVAIKAYKEGKKLVNDNLF